MIDPLLPEARKFEDARLIAEATLLRGHSLLDLGRLDDAARELEAAYATSLDSSLFLIAADAATQLVELEAIRGHWVEAEQWSEHSASWLRRADVEPRRRLASLGRARSRLAAERGDVETSALLAQEALELARDVHEGPGLIPFINAAGQCTAASIRLRDRQTQLRRSPGPRPRSVR